MTRSRTDSPRRTPPNAAADLARLQRLSDLVDALRRGAAFPVTRLTAVKTLCREPEDAAAFLKHLAEVAYANMTRGAQPEALSVREWSRHRRLGRCLRSPWWRDPDILPRDVRLSDHHRERSNDRVGVHRSEGAAAPG